MGDLNSEMERVYQAVRAYLFTGAASRLSRRMLARELGVSQAGVQAALGRLEGEGVLEVRPQSGTQVRRPDQEEYHQIYDLRELMEPYAAGRAAPRITTRQLARIDRALRDHSALLDRIVRGRGTNPTADEIAKGIAVEHAFHDTILEAADNPTAHQFVGNLQILALYARSAASWPRVEYERRSRKAVAEHAAITAALRARQPDEAERLMREHVRGGRYWPPENWVASIA